MYEHIITGDYSSIMHVDVIIIKHIIAVVCRLDTFIRESYDYKYVGVHVVNCQSQIMCSAVWYSIECYEFAAKFCHVSISSLLLYISLEC